MWSCHYALGYYGNNVIKHRENDAFPIKMLHFKLFPNLNSDDSDI